MKSFTTRKQSGSWELTDITLVLPISGQKLRRHLKVS
jgi:hypothetical protein